MVFDVGEADFEQRVLERSGEVPVVVDFWAEWCAPCRQLTPALERAVAAREGRVDLAKVDVDQNQSLAQAFGVQGIPAVKAFRDGRVAAEFTGAVPPPEVERFFDRLVPSDAELEAAAAIESGDDEALRRALASDPKNAAVAAALARLLIARGENEEALEVLEPFDTDFLAAGLAERARLGLSGQEDLAAAFEAWDSGDYATALEELQAALAAASDPDTRDSLRKAMVAIFTELGPDSELAREHRRRLSAVLY
jgi:putative thioredoxin